MTVFQKLSIIIPAYNEGKTIIDVLNKLSEVQLLDIMSIYFKSTI